MSKDTIISFLIGFSLFFILSWPAVMLFKNKENKKQSIVINCLWMFIVALFVLLVGGILVISLGVGALSL
jgi:hypothetical protein